MLEPMQSAPLCVCVCVCDHVMCDIKINVVCYYYLKLACQ